MVAMRGRANQWKAARWEGAVTEQEMEWSIDKVRGPRVGTCNATSQQVQTVGEIKERR